MIKQSVLPADQFVVTNKTTLNDQDKKNIVMLYQPIIGSNAANLYFTLVSYLDKEESLSISNSHHDLMVGMQKSLESIIIAREKLEAVGLLKTYFKKGEVNSFIYELYSPLSPHEFINNPILSVALLSNVGKLKYDQIISYYKVPKYSLRGYKEITCLFNEVFEPVNLSGFNGEVSDIKSYQKNKILLETNFNLDDILASIPDDVLIKKTVNKDLKDLIYKLVFVYNLNDEEVYEIIFNAINERHSIDKKLLRENARKLYKYENNGELPSLIYKNQPDYLRAKLNDDSKRSKMIYTFETTTPYDFLCSKYHGSKPTKTDLKLIEYLLVDLNLKPGVVNVLVDYVLKINNNKLNKAFVEAIAGQWCKAKIMTVSSAMKIAEDEYRNKKTKKTKKVKEKPDWFDQKLDENKATDEEIAELDKMLSEFR